jgi:predicted lipoprotein with Yx(FWY)xxD motif
MRISSSARARAAFVTAAVVALSVGTVSVGLASEAGAATMHTSAAGPAAAVARAATVVTTMSTTAYGTILVVGGTGPLAGAPLYEITSDTEGHFGCTTTVESTFQGPITCTGPESDVFRNVTTDEWPSLDTKGDPVAGPGVNPELLGSVRRPGVGRQVTYAGHPLYLFDPPSNPFVPFGEGFLETVAPVPPWHGLWDLVSSSSGVPAPGVATIESETLPNGKEALAALEYPNAVPGGVAFTVYTYSQDSRDDSDCGGSCASTWIPVLSSGTPQAAAGVGARALGLHYRADGTFQVTFHGMPLYLYSGEQAVFSGQGGPPSSTGTVSNGNGLTGPHGGQFSLIPRR